MSNDAIAGFMCFGCFGWIILACIFMSVGQQDGSLRVAGSGSGVTFRKRTSDRIGGTMFGTLVLVGPPIQYGQGMMNAVHHHQPVPLWAYFALLFGVLIGGGFGGLMLYLSGPRDLYLDPDRRTYRFVSGWPLCPRVQAGTWEDMAGIYIRRYGGGDRGVTYVVEIAWRQEWPQCPPLGRFFGREDAANALAEEMSAALGLPLIAPPSRGRTSASPNDMTLLKKSEARPYRPFRSTLFSSPDVSEPRAVTEQLTGKVGADSSGGKDKMG